METDVPGDAEHKTRQEAESQRPDETAADVQPIVLPVVIVPNEQSNSGETASKSEQLGDSPPTGSQQTGSQEAEGAHTRIRLDPQLTAPDVREQVDRMQHRHELPLSTSNDDPGGDVTMGEAIAHLVELTENRMRELDQGNEGSLSHAIGTPGPASPGDVALGILRHDDPRGSLRRLSDSGDDNASSRADGRPESPSGPAVFVNPPPSDGAAPMPRLQIVVQMAHNRAMYAEAVEEALEKHAPQYREIARLEVQDGFWEYESQRRAADWRLRGP